MFTDVTPAPPALVAKRPVPPEAAVRVTVVEPAFAGFPYMSRRSTVSGPMFAVAEATPVTESGEVTTSCVAVPAVTLKLVLTAPEYAWLEATRVYAVPALSMERLLKVATPVASVVANCVPESVPPPGFDPMLMVTGTSGTGTSPDRVRAATRSVAIDEPAVTFPAGCDSKVRLLALMTLTLLLGVLTAVHEW